MLLNKTNLQKLVLASLSANNTYKLVIKKLIFCLILFPCSAYSKDHISQAIIKSDSNIVKQEIKKRILSNNPTTLQEQRYYIDLCQEVIIRRRNAIQFPRYSDGTPVYTPAFQSDVIPTISAKETFTMLTSLIGAIISLPLGFSIAQETKPPMDGLVILTTVATEFTCLGIIIYLIVKRDRELKQLQEQLYENAIEIKHILLNMQAI